MNKLHVDEHEYAYLKVISLFSSDLPNLICKKQVDHFQEKSFQALRSYVHHSFPDDLDRFPRYENIHITFFFNKTVSIRLLLRLPPLRALDPQVLEELFFGGLMGSIQVDSVIPYILQLGAKQTGNCGRPVKSEQIEEFVCK